MSIKLLKRIFINNKISNSKLLVSQAICIWILGTLSFYFVSLHKAGAIFADTKVSDTFSFINETLFNIDKIYIYTAALLSFALIYFGNKRLKNGKINIETCIKYLSAIIFNKLMTSFNLIIGLAFFLRISSLSVDFVDLPLHNFFEFLALGFLVTHALTFWVKSFLCKAPNYK